MIYISEIYFDSLISADYKRNQLWYVTLRYLAVMHRSPSQNNDKFDNFLNNFDNFLNKISKSSSLCTVILGEFSTGSFSWWINDKTTTEGKHSQVQWFSTLPTYCLNPFFALISSSLINPTWWSVVAFTQHFTLTVNFNLLIANFSWTLNILPFMRLIWNYKKANKKNISQSI